MEEHIVSKVFIENAIGQILILRRSKTAPQRPLKWDLPGGWVEPNEDPLEACRRELEEEAGIVAEDFTEVFRVEEADENRKLIRIYAKAATDSDKVILSYEHDTYLWVDKKEYLDYITHEPQMDAFKEVYQVA